MAYYRASLAGMMDTQSFCCGERTPGRLWNEAASGLPLKGLELGEQGNRGATRASGRNHKGRSGVFAPAESIPQGEPGA